ncbi:MAG: sigma-70 family RNA polymerase sigma factor [Oscillospiraceae bacterium]|nr:sigma-70 family RNA polymerase sigma factor [Oscillospiraceae bacterium]
MQQNEQITDLVKRAVKGDRDAMSDLYTHTCQRTYRTILGLVRDEQTAQDLTQETYMAAFSGLDRLEDPARFQPWLISTAVHKSKNQLRSAKPLLFSELEGSAVPEEMPDARAEASPEISLDRAETARIVRELLGELNESQQLAVELFYYDQLSTTEIARSLDIPQSTVKTQLHYARKKLEAGLRRLQSKGVELGGLTALGCFGLLRTLPEEPILPRAEAEAIRSKILSQTPVKVAARTGGQLLRGALGKVLLGVLGVAAAGGLILGGAKLLRSAPEIGDEQPAQTSSAQETGETEALSIDYGKDFDGLWTVLERDYPFLPFLETQGSNLETVRGYYRDQAAKAQTTDDYVTVLGGLFDNGLKRTGAIRLITPEEYPYFFLFDEFAEAESAAAAAWAAVLEDPNLSPLYQKPEPGSGEAAAPYGSKSPVVRWYEAEKTVSIAFSDCILSNAERDRDLVRTALAEHPEAENLIVDLRGNAGGDFEYWKPVLLEPLGGDWSWSARAFYRDTPITAPFYADFDAIPVSALDEAPAWAADLRLDRCFSMELESHSNLPETALKRWVLTDNQSCGGAAWLAAFCRGTGWATVLGSHTSTGFGLGAVGVLELLPESGLLLQFGEAVETPDGGLDAETGVLPDVSCNPKQALETCLSLIRESK